MKFLRIYSLLPLAFVMRSVSGQNTPLPVYIGDNAEHTIYREYSAECVIDDIEIDIGLDHTYAGDLTIVVEHMDGTQVTLVDEGGGSADYVDEKVIFYRKNYGSSTLQTSNGVVEAQTLQVADLAAFQGKPSAGRWKILVTDGADGDNGMVRLVNLKACLGGSDSGEGLGDSLPPGAADDLLPPPDSSTPDDDISELGLAPPSTSGGLDSFLPPGTNFDFSDTTDPSPTTDDQAASTDDRTGGGGGDPHFKTWTGIKYDYHGECDLVLVNNPSFADGLGLRVHIRTVRVGYFSYIERTAIQIGDDVLEFVNRKSWTLNGEKAKTGRQHIGGFEMFKFKKAISIRLDNKSKTKIDLFDRNNGMPYIVIDGGKSELFKGSLGMIGDWATGQMIGRDGVTVIENPDSFAREWQVRDTEPMLFSTVRAPQYPAVCVPPEKMMGNRLGNSHMMKMAEKACAAWGDDKDDCIFDVMATRDIRAAESIAVNM